MVAYVSNIAPGWSLESQVAILGSCPVFADRLTDGELQRRDATALIQRSAALEAARNDDATLTVAALAVLGWQGDIAAVFAQAAGYGLTIRAVQEQVSITPATPCELAMLAWSASRVAGSRALGRLSGSLSSAHRRKRDTDARVAAISERWGMPSEQWPTPVLLAEAGISLNTAKSRLGSRAVAQRQRLAGLPRQDALAERLGARKR